MKNKWIYFFLPFVSALCLSIFIQHHFLFSNDVGYLLHAANQLLSGGRYGNEIFETNPPMILYLYMPAVILNKLIHGDIITVMRGYIFALAAISAFISFLLLKKIFTKNMFVVYSLFYAVLFVLFFLSCDDFGQREHFFLIFCLPYFFSASLNLSQQPQSILSRVLIGFFAGLGFAIKPFFLFPLILIETYFIFYRKRIFGWVRIESLTILLVLVSYLCSIYLLQPEYLKIILPLVNDLYFIGIKQPWSYVLLSEVVLWLLIPIGLYFIFYKKDQYRSFSTTLFLAMLGLAMTVIAPRALWYYHAIPMLGLACILLSYQYSMFVAVPKTLVPAMTRLDSLMLILIALIIFFIPIRYVVQRSEYFFWDKNHGERFNLISTVAKLETKDSIACFSVHMDCFPLSDITHKTFTSSFPLLWWLKGVLIQEKHSTRSPSLAKEKKMLIDKVAEDLNQFKTQLVILNPEDGYGILDRNFNYIAYFSTNEKFKNAWKNYSYLTTVGFYQIYQRNKNAS
jgi:hypothetical protein